MATLPRRTRSGRGSVLVLAALAATTALTLAGCAPGGSGPKPSGNTDVSTELTDEKVSWSW